MLKEGREGGVKGGKGRGYWGREVEDPKGGGEEVLRKKWGIKRVRRRDMGL